MFITSFQIHVWETFFCVLVDMCFRHSYSNVFAESASVQWIDVVYYFSRHGPSQSSLTTLKTVVEWLVYRHCWQVLEVRQRHSTFPLYMWLDLIIWSYIFWCHLSWDLGVFNYCCSLHNFHFVPSSLLFSLLPYSCISFFPRHLSKIMLFQVSIVPHVFGASSSSSSADVARCCHPLLLEFIQSSCEGVLLLLTRQTLHFCSSCASLIVCNQQTIIWDTAACPWIRC